MRLTRQRQIILKAVQENRNHPDADFIYHLLKPQHPELSLGTVYRNLNVLSQAGLITKMTTPFQREHYDGENGSHYHLFCKKCHNIVDIHIPYKKALDQEIQQNTKCFVQSHEIIFHGICEKCQIVEKNEQD